MSEIAVEDFFHPVAIRETLRAMPAEVLLATFAAALIETLENGIKGAPPVCKQRVATLRSELEQVQELVEMYLRRHFHTRAGHSVKVRQLLLSNMIISLDEGMKALAMPGGELYGPHTLRYASPRNRRFRGHPNLKPFKGAGGGGQRV